MHDCGALFDFDSCVTDVSSSACLGRSARPCSRLSFPSAGIPARRASEGTRKARYKNRRSRDADQLLEISRSFSRFSRERERGVIMRLIPFGSL